MNAVRVSLKMKAKMAVLLFVQSLALMALVLVLTFVNVKKDTADHHVMFVSFHDCMLSIDNTHPTLNKHLSIKACPPNRYGKKCSKKCSCANDALCDPYDGKCLCQKGYQGSRCDMICPPDHYGENCQEICQCKNNGTCHHISGLCHCQPGFNGPL